MSFDGLVSVVIPSYNRAKTIERAVNSVLQQTYRNLEVIVVDDCSKDNTQQVVESIPDERVRYCRMPANGGACAARNYGVEQSKGSIVAFQDSDDAWYPEKLEKQLAYMLDNGYEFISCGLRRVWDEGEEIVGILDCPEDPVALWCQLLDNNWVSTQTVLCYKSCFEKIAFDRSVKRYQDWDLALQAARYFKVGVLKECLVDVFVQSDSITVNVDSTTFKRQIILKHGAFLKPEEKRMVAQYHKSLADIERAAHPRIASKHYWISFVHNPKVKSLMCCALSMVGFFKFYRTRK